MNTFLSLLFMQIAISTVTSAPNTGRIGNERIVGGIEADRHEFKFFVDMRVGLDDSYHFCGGSIISPEWIITSALCGQSGGYTLTAGDHNIAISEGTEQVRSVVEVKVHPLYNKPGTLEHEYDIALMKVAPPFEFNEFVQPARLPDENFTLTAIATVTGWGTISQHDGEEPVILRKVDVPHVDDETCNINYNNGIAPSMICYGEAGKDFCLGDRGGPLLCGDDQVLCGIVSWAQGCAQPGFPGVYTETSYFLDWIRKSYIPTDEDESPVQTVTNCGGLIEASSVLIDFQVGESDQNCVWTVQAPYESIRFRLTFSELDAENDAIYVTSFSNAQPGSHERLVAVGNDYTVAAGTALITLIAGNSTTRRFRLEAFSSGLLDQSPDFTGYTSLPYSAGSVTYPDNGENYNNNENVLFVVSPSIPRPKALRFTAMELENGTECRYDAVTIYNWEDNKYKQVARVCGTTLPPITTLESGLGLVTFQTDVSQTDVGFSFEWV